MNMSQMLGIVKSHCPQYLWYSFGEDQTLWISDNHYAFILYRSLIEGVTWKRTTVIISAYSRHTDACHLTAKAGNAGYPTSRLVYGNGSWCDCDELSLNHLRVVLGRRIYNQIVN